ncbi:MAG TPA: adenylate/guanylate cyclase domain-containing protein [Rectinemataceae bacterium]|nr:adenylate/guanylate cyclase domain-containing protein [Rectinemataceae bacterium]
MKFFAKRFVEEFLLYSSQFIVFFVLMLALIPSSDALQPASLLMVSAFLLIQIGLLAIQGQSPLLRFLYSFITPAGYALVRSLGGTFILTDMGNLFIWGAAFYIGLFQSLSIAFRDRLVQSFTETFLAIGSVVIYVFFYYYLDLRVGLSAALSTGSLDIAGFRKALDIRSFPKSIFAFVASPQHAFFAFGAAIFAALLLANRVRVLSLRNRISGLFGESRLSSPVPRPGPALGEEIQVVVLSADVLDFTGFASRLTASRAVDVLNRYYSLWGIVAERHHGEVVGVTGDSILAVFGLLGDKDAGEAAVATVADFLEAMPGLQDDLRAASLPALGGVSIGIHSGTIVAGDLGLPGQRRIGVFGDAVSVAARLDSLCREFKQDLLISQPVFRQLGLETQARFDKLGEVLLRNGVQPMPVYGFK